MRPLPVSFIYLSAGLCSSELLNILHVNNLFHVSGIADCYYVSDIADYCPLCLADFIVKHF